MPSLVAVIDALPAATADTAPLLLTVATLVFELDHAIARPVRTLPVASFSTAVACVLWPGVSVEEPSETATVATGAGGGGGVVVTDSVTPELIPSLTAVIVAAPALTPLAKPLDALTVATPVFELFHATVRPVSTLPLASCMVAVSCTLLPTRTLGAGGDIETDATAAAAIFTPAVADLPPA